MEELSFLIWNTRGIGADNFLSTLHELIRMNRPSVFGLVETQISGTRADEVCRCMGFNGMLYVDPQDFIEGIWLLRKTDMVNVSSISLNSQHIIVKVKKWVVEPWILSAVYPSSNSSTRHDLWRIWGKNNKQLLLAGEFNATLTAQDRSSSVTLSISVLLVRYIVRLLGELCAPSIGRGLCSDAYVHHLSVPHSDHLPFLVKLVPLANAPSNNRSFRLLAPWLAHEGFDSLLRRVWNPDTLLTDSLHLLFERLNDMNKNVFGNIFTRKKLWRKLERVQKRLSHRLSSGLIFLERELKLELESVLQ
ncbi:hypothetical protein V2J09_004529 [Rumex salicifolius]